MAELTAIVNGLIGLAGAFVVLLTIPSAAFQAIRNKRIPAAIGLIITGLFLFGLSISYATIGPAVFTRISDLFLSVIGG